MDFSSFPLGPFVISTGGVILLLGIFAATLVLLRTVRQKGLDIGFLSNNLFLLLLVPLLFGRIGAFLELYGPLAKRMTEAPFLEKITLFFQYFFTVWEGGFDELWVILGFLLVFIADAFAKKEPVWKWLDAFVLPGVMVIIFINIGGFFSGWGYGKPAPEDFFLAITYDIPSVRFAGPIHPIQLYAAGAFGLLFYIGIRLWRKSLKARTHWNDGTYFGIMTFSAALLNGLLEFFRGESTKMIFENVRLTQILSFGIALGVAIFLAIHTHERKMPLQEPTEEASDATEPPTPE